MTDVIGLRAIESCERPHGTREQDVDGKSEHAVVAMPARCDDVDPCEREIMGGFEFLPDEPNLLLGGAPCRPNYTEAQQAERERLIGLIEAEKRAYLERLEPHVQALTKIDAAAERTFVVQDEPRADIPRARAAAR